MAGFTEVATSPRSPLELKIQSPRSRLKNYDVGGIGLGIVAALENDDGGEIDQVKRAAAAVYGQNLINRIIISTPIPVLNKQQRQHSASNPAAAARVRAGRIEDDMDSYTYHVTCHGGPNTRVYDDGVSIHEYGTTIETTGFDIRNKNFKLLVTFAITPPAPEDIISLFPTSDFLSSCHLCRNNLHGKDIYMYRGEKAFCSTECRYKEIVMDEQKKKTSAAAAADDHDVSKSPYTSNGHMFSTGILAI